MALTLRAVLTELDNLSTQGEIDEIGRDQIVDSVARAALLGARGNSGVILSQLIRGAAEELISRPGRARGPGPGRRRHGARRRPRVRHRCATPPRAPSSPSCARWPRAPRPRSPTWPSRGCSTASTTRRRTRCSPTCSSTRWTPARPPSSAAPSCCRSCASPAWSTPAATASRSSSRASSRPCAAPSRRRSSTTRPPASRTPSTTPRPTATARTSRSRATTWSRRRGCRGWRRSATPCWWSATPRRLKVHVHTDEPERATDLFDGVGEVSRLDVADMHEQVEQRTARVSEVIDTCGVLAVVNGDGMRVLFEGMGAHVLDGGPDAEPEHLRAAGRHPRRPRRGGRRPARTRPTSGWPPSAPPS